MLTIRPRENLRARKVQLLLNLDGLELNFTRSGIIGIFGIMALMFMPELNVC